MDAMPPLLGGGAFWLRGSQLVQGDGVPREDLSTATASGPARLQPQDLHCGSPLFNLGGAHADLTVSAICRCLRLRGGAQEVDAAMDGWSAARAGR